MPAPKPNASATPVPFVRTRLQRSGPNAAPIKTAQHTSAAAAIAGKQAGHAAATKDAANGGSGLESHPAFKSAHAQAYGMVARRAGFVAGAHAAHRQLDAKRDAERGVEVRHRFDHGGASDSVDEVIERIREKRERDAADDARKQNKRLPLEDLMRLTPHELAQQTQRASRR